MGAYQPRGLMKITIALTLLALLAGNVKCSEVVQLDEDASASFLQAMSAGAITEAKAFDGCKKSNENSHEAVDLLVSAKATDKNTGHSGNTNKLAVRCCKGTGDSLQCKTRESNKLSCTANVDYGQAVAKCGQLGAEWTLCTVAQLETKKCCGTGCNFDQHYVWTKEAAKCSAGHYLSNAACEQCAAGKFADAGSASCTACDAGKYSSAKRELHSLRRWQVLACWIRQREQMPRLCRWQVLQRWRHLHSLRFWQVRSCWRRLHSLRFWQVLRSRFCVMRIHQARQQGMPQGQN